MPAKKTPATGEPDFFDKPGNIRWLLRIFYGICVLLVLLDFVIHRHIETAIEKLPAFYAGYGFIACVLLVLLATQLRKWLMRGANYYSTESEPPAGSGAEGREERHP